MRRFGLGIIVVALLVLVSPIGAAKAKSSQKTPTFEETVAYLNENLPKWNYNQHNSDSSGSTTNYRLSGCTLLETVYGNYDTWDRGFLDFNWDLRWLKRVTVEEHDVSLITLSGSGDFRPRSYYRFYADLDHHSVDGPYVGPGEVHIRFQMVDMANRIARAFQLVQKYCTQSLPHSEGKRRTKPR